MAKYLKIILSLVIAISLFIFSGHLALAKADDLVIQDDGSIVLVFSKPVLAASTDQLKQIESAIEKVIEVAPAHAQNTVEVNPTPTKDQKIEVTVKTEAKGKAPAKEEKKSVDQIVAQGADKKPIFTIAPNKSNRVSIKQGSIEAATPLPLTIDAKSKSVSTKVGNEQVKIQVLPKDAVKKVEDNGLIGAPKPTVTLQAQNGEAVYNVSGTREEKLFNVIDLTGPVTVSVSAQTGRTTRVSQPVIFNLVDFLSKGTF